MDNTNYLENETKKREIEKEDKKALPKLIILTIISGILGALFAIFALKVLGYINGNTEVSLIELFQQMQLSLANGVGYACFVSSILLSAVVFFIYSHYRKQGSVMNLEEEENREKLEGGLNKALLITTVNMILSWVFFGTGFYCITEREKTDFLSLLLCLVGFILSIACTSITQQKVINLTKTLNPEKNGSVYDLKFHKKWMDSCDEAERFYIYKCCYASYNATQVVCLILIVIIVLAGMIFPIGVLPLICVCIIWGVSSIVYGVTAMKVERMKE